MPRWSRRVTHFGSIVIAMLSIYVLHLPSLALQIAALVGIEIAAYILLTFAVATALGIRDGLHKVNNNR